MLNKATLSFLLVAFLLCSCDKYDCQLHTITNTYADDQKIQFTNDTTSFGYYYWITEGENIVFTYEEKYDCEGGGGRQSTLQFEVPANYTLFDFKDEDLTTRNCFVHESGGDFTNLYYFPIMNGKISGLKIKDDRWALNGSVTFINPWTFNQHMETISFDKIFTK